MTGTALAKASPALLTLWDTARKLDGILEVLPLETPEDEAKAGVLLTELRGAILRAETARKAEKDPHWEQCQEIDRAWREPRTRLEEIEKQLRARISQAVEARERAIRESTAKVLTAKTMAEANEAKALAPLEIDPPVPVRWYWEVESVDLTKVPDEYIARSLDMTRVAQEVSKAVLAGTTPVVPGVTFVHRAKTIVRGAR